MAKTAKAAAKTTAGKTAKKRATSSAHTARRAGKPTGTMSEKTKRLTLRAFQMVYDSHHRKTA